MSLLSTGSVQNDKVVFSQDFISRRYVQDAQGVLVGCNVGLRGPGIISTSAASRVTYDRTQSTLINANKMTIRVRFRTGAAVPTNKYLLCKTPSAGADNQFMMLFDSGFLRCFIADAPADLTNNAYPNVAVVGSAEYLYHYVYDGSLAPASRILIYLAGLPVAKTIGGTIPAVMRVSASPITVFQAAGGSLNAPATDFTFFDAKIWSVALTAAECLDDANAKTFSVTT